MPVALAVTPGEQINAWAELSQAPDPIDHFLRNQSIITPISELVWKSKRPKRAETAYYIYAHSYVLSIETSKRHVLVQGRVYLTGKLKVYV